MRCVGQTAAGGRIKTRPFENDRYALSACDVLRYNITNITNMVIN
jgi:hypothetical protein